MAVDQQQGVQVRPLKGKDLRIMTRLIYQISGEAREEIKTIVSIFEQDSNDGLDETTDPEERKRALADKQQRELDMGISVLTLILKHAEEDIWPWIADLGMMSVNELDDSDISTPLDILVGVVEQDQFPHFFSKARDLVKRVTQISWNSSSQDTAGPMQSSMRSIIGDGRN